MTSRAEKVSHELQTNASRFTRRGLLRGLSIGALGVGLGVDLSPGVHRAVAASAEGISTATKTTGSTNMNELKSELLFESHFELAPPQVIETPSGVRQVILATNGQIQSPKFTVAEPFLPGTGDWLRIRNDGVLELAVSWTFRLDDDNLVFATFGGVAAVPEAVFGRIMGGEEVDPGEYYFRVTPRFQTGSEEYGWLNNVICVANGKAGPGLQWVEYTAFQIL